MVNYGKYDIDDEPTSTHIHRAERKYRGHKLAQGVNHVNLMRHRGGESAKRNGKKVVQRRNPAQ